MWWWLKGQGRLRPAEIEILGRLLVGDTQRLDDLRRQWQPPFNLGISRHHPRTRPPYRTPPNQYHLLQIYDGNLVGEFTIDSGLSLDITDFWIRDKRVPLPVQVIGKIHQGILATLVFQTERPVRWPRFLRMDDYWYVDFETRKHTERQDVSSFEAPSIRVQWTDLPKGWVRTAFDESVRAGFAVTAMPPADEEAIRELCRKTRVEIPDDYAAFLGLTNGASLQGWQILGTNDAYRLDEDVYAHEHVVISADVGGFPVVLEPRSGNVLLLDDTATPDVLALSFSAWIGSLLTDQSAA